MSDIRKSLILAAINNKAVALTDEFRRQIVFANDSHEKTVAIKSQVKCKAEIKF